MMASALPLLLVVAAIVALGATGNLFTLSPALAVQAAAIGLSIWARRSFKAGTFRVAATPGGSAIINDGPYRIVRHPMYAAMLLFVWTAVLSHLSAFTLTIGLFVTVVVITRVIVEERVLRATFPDYDAYARTTSAIVPYVF